MDDESAPTASATGILQCLRMLAAEADSLRLDRTFLALREAVKACEAEVLAEKMIAGKPDPSEPMLPVDMRLH